jgi:hypothetical protein
VQPDTIHRIPDHAWPSELDELFSKSVTAEYASLTRTGAPVTIPTTPYVGQHGTLDVSTGLTYPAKAERARRNPRVCLLFADPFGEAMGSAPVAVVQGHAAVRDSDLQANTDRYTRVAQIKLPAATKGQPKFILRRMAFYYARIWIEITPLRILWWSDRSMEEAPTEWRAPEGTAKPASDPAPPGNPPPAWREPPSDWRPLARRALSELPLADLTFVDAEGVPMCIPVQTTGLADDSVALKVGAGAPGLLAGHACLSNSPDRRTTLSSGNSRPPTSRCSSGCKERSPTGAWRAIVQTRLSRSSAPEGPFLPASEPKQLAGASRFPMFTSFDRCHCPSNGPGTPRHTLEQWRWVGQMLGRTDAG